MSHCRFTVGCAPAGGNNMIVAVDAKEYPLFNFSQDHMTFIIDNVLQAFFFNILQQNIGVEISFCQHFGKDNTNGAFPGTGHAD